MINQQNFEFPNYLAIFWVTIDVNRRNIINKIQCDDGMVYEYDYNYDKMIYFTHNREAEAFLLLLFSNCYREKTPHTMIF